MKKPTNDQPKQTANESYWEPIISPCDDGGFDDEKKEYAEEHDCRYDWVFMVISCHQQRSYWSVNIVDGEAVGKIDISEQFIVLRWSVSEQEHRVRVHNKYEKQ